MMINTRALFLLGLVLLGYFNLGHALISQRFNFIRVLNLMFHVEHHRARWLIILLSALNP